MSGRVVREERTVTFEWVGPKDVNGERRREVRTCVVELEIDIERLFAQLGEKAARSSGGKAIDAGGAVCCRRRTGGRTVKEG